MLILFDHSVQEDFKEFFKNHEVTTAQAAQLDQAADRVLLDRAPEHCEVLVTRDQHIQNQQNLSKCRVGIIVLAGANDPDIFARVTPQIDHALETVKPGQCLSVKPEICRLMDSKAVSAVNRRQVEMEGGRPGVRDEVALEEVIGDAKQSFYRQGKDLYDVAATYAAGLLEKQPFNDHNQKTAARVAVSFMERNGIDTSRLSEQQASETLKKLANYQISSEELGKTFRSTLSREKTAEASQGAGEAARTRAAERQRQQQSEQER